MANKKEDETRFDKLKKRFLNNRIGVIIALFVLIISSLAALLGDFTKIRSTFSSSYNLAISGKAPDQFREYQEEKVELEILLSGSPKKIIDNAIVTLKILDEYGVPLDSASTFNAFILPKNPIIVPPLSREVSQRKVSVLISTQTPGNYILLAQVSAGNHNSQTRININVAQRKFRQLENLAHANNPLVVVSDGMARYQRPITELNRFMIVVPDHIVELGYFNSTLFIESTYVGAAGGLTWGISQNKKVGDISSEYFEFVETIKSEHSEGYGYELTNAFDHGEALVLIGDTWYQLTIIDAQRIRIKKRVENCSPISGMNIGVAQFKSPEVFSLEGEKWFFKDVDLEVIDGTWDYGATGRIGSADIEVNGKLYQLIDNVNEAGFKFYDGFPLRFKLDDGRVAKLYADPLSVFICDPVHINRNN